MISVLTLTYKRTKLLEEALQSFLFQKINQPKELVIINDNKNTEYFYNHPEVKIFNLKNRFNSISSKLKWGVEKCKYNYIYRLDDDDLLTENALELACNEILKNIEYDIYRSDLTHYFLNYEYKGLINTINNGVIYTKKYLNRINWPDLNLDEDTHIIYGNNANIFNIKTPIMIHRGGMETFHISYGCAESPDKKLLKIFSDSFYLNIKNEEILNFADKVLTLKYNHIDGKINLKPNFKKKYYEELSN